MFITEYSHSKSYYHFEVPGELPEEGILKGKEGELRFKRIHDGFAAYDSTLINSGFVYPGSADDVYVPHTINDIPVTELHQTILLKSRNPFAIENGNLKRVFIKIGKKFLENSSVEVEIDFCGNPGQQVELCSIMCDDKLVLHMPSAKTVAVNANKTELRGSIPSCVEEMTFSGKVYPFIENGWDGDEPNNRCFEGLKNLRTVEGSLSGNLSWSFSNCTSLESIHLSNGVERIPAYAFSNCSSLKDLYIPDTVLEIGAYAFSGCENLVSIHLPSNLKKISEGMFNGCKSLKKVYLSDSIEIIEAYAFAGCVSLRKPWIPKNIKHIAETAFSAL